VIASAEHRRQLRQRLDPNLLAAARGGNRYVEDRDTTTVVSGSKDSATTFTERWTLALDGPDDAPWRLIKSS